MKLEKKAYRIVFPGMFDYSSDSPLDDKIIGTNEYSVIYGATQKEAVNECCRGYSWETGWSWFELKTAARTRRDKAKDLYSSDRSKVLDTISKKQLHILTHSLGVEKGDVEPEKYYRNYYVVDVKNDDCEGLVELGLMGRYYKLDNYVYHVTDIGKEAIETLLLTIKQITK